MPHMTHIVRFKVVSIECDLLHDGQQYTIYYRRGDTRRSTPCYTARNGVVDFSMMPEGAAIIHFKNGGVNRRFAPKYILFRLEEYIVGVPRRVVCEANVDCSTVLGPFENSGSGVIEVPLHIWGPNAKMKVAILVYPENGLPLSFDAILKPQESDYVDKSAGKVLAMSRGEAMTLLISLETVLERKRQANPPVTSTNASKSELKVFELEQKRSKLTRVEGMASKVVTARCHDVVGAHFVALARKFRNNYIGVTAAYLRQMALMSGIALADKRTIKPEVTIREQLSRTNNRIEDLKQQIYKLEQSQLALGRIQHKADVTAELMANLEKVDSLNAQIKVLEQSKEANQRALLGRDDSEVRLGREVKVINEHIAKLEVEQEQLRAQIEHMVTTAAAHVLSWARSKNPPHPDFSNKSTIDNLFHDAQPGSFGEKVTTKLVPVSTDLISVPPPQSRQSSSPSDYHTSKGFFGARDLPSMEDFKVSETNHLRGEEESVKPQIPDPLKPVGLDTDMFARTNPEPTISNSLVPPLPSKHNAMEEPGFRINVLTDPPHTQGIETFSLNNDKHKDPYYDEMDYFTPPKGVDNINCLSPIEIFSHLKVGDATEDNPTFAATTHVQSSSKPKFNFGPSEDTEGAAIGRIEGSTFHDTHTMTFDSPTYNFAPTADNESEENDSKIKERKYGIPAYDFAS